MSRLDVQFTQLYFLVVWDCECVYSFFVNSVLPYSSSCLWVNASLKWSYKFMCVCIWTQCDDVIVSVSISNRSVFSKKIVLIFNSTWEFEASGELIAWPDWETLDSNWKNNSYRQLVIIHCCFHVFWQAHQFPMDALSRNKSCLYIY